MIRRRPPAHLAGVITDLCAYRETMPGRLVQRETASLVVPLVISLGSPFSIALGRNPGPSDRQPSFAAGLYPGPVHIASDGAAECVQVNLTPLGAYRLFGGAVAELAARMVDIEAVLGPAAGRLRQRLGETTAPGRRLALVEDFIAARLARQPSPEIAFAWRELARNGGTRRIAGLAGEIGWSRKHFSGRFAAEIGLAPKVVARMMRFDRACRLALAGGGAGWADIAAEAAYADQAHLAREFAELAGEPPRAWARRAAASDPRLALRQDG